LAWFLLGVIISMLTREFDQIGCILLITSDQSFVLHENSTFKEAGVVSSL